MVRAFGRSGSPSPLAGGQGRSWRLRDVVLKPWDGGVDALEWQHATLTAVDGRNDVRVSPPLRTADGALTVSGWSAWRWEPGRHPPAPRWGDVLAAGRRLHAALAGAGPPSGPARTDAWAVADRVAWGEAEPPDVPVIRTLLAASRPVAGTPQLVHGDLSGNVLFDADRPPLVIDLSPYWRPRAYADAIVVADALLFHGGTPDLLDLLDDGPDRGQYLLRALLFRLATGDAAAARATGCDVVVAHVLRLARA